MRHNTVPIYTGFFLLTSDPQSAGQFCIPRHLVFRSVDIVYGMSAKFNAVEKGYTKRQISHGMKSLVSLKEVIWCLSSPRCLGNFGEMWGMGKALPNSASGAE